jgi:hypothetical protein
MRELMVFTLSYKHAQRSLYLNVSVESGCAALGKKFVNMRRKCIKKCTIAPIKKPPG